MNQFERALDWVQKDLDRAKEHLTKASGEVAYYEEKLQYVKSCKNLCRSCLGHGRFEIGSAAGPYWTDCDTCRGTGIVP
jgi:DnaJ-class molecular chaperone